MEHPANVVMERDGQRTDVTNDGSVKVMEAQGWVVVSDGNGDGKTTAAELKAALDAKGIAYKGNASKAELQALLDGASAAS